MRFTAAQVALFKSGISFVHMAPNEERRQRAKRDFTDAIAGTYYGNVDYSTVYSGSGESFARFMLCRIAGEASERVPVMFVDGKKSEFPDQRAYDEARYLPAKINDCGPMVVR